MRRFNFDRFRDTGLLILRVGVGVGMMVFHGWPKLAGGPARWQGLGEAVGIGFMPTLFGFLGMVLEFGGGALFALGLLFRPTAFLLCCMMLAATGAHVLAGDPFGSLSHALKLAFVFLGMMVVGPGRYSVDSLYGDNRRLGF